MPHTLQREMFETNRQLEYFSEKELSMQLGAAPARWGVVLIKELIDNAWTPAKPHASPPRLG